MLSCSALISNYQVRESYNQMQVCGFGVGGTIGSLGYIFIEYKITT